MTEENAGNESATNQTLQPDFNRMVESEFSKRGTEVFPQAPIQAAPADSSPSAPSAITGVDPPQQSAAPTDGPGGGSNEPS